MTIEEAIKWLNVERELIVEIPQDNSRELKEAYDMAIKALEQQPCEDAVSREAVMKCFKKWQPYMATRLWDYEQELRGLPSVTPTRPKGEWIEPDRHYDREIYRKCSNCNTNVDVNVMHLGMGIHIIPKKMYFCPVCGADMRGDADDED